MDVKPLHPHRALWVLAATVLVGALVCGAYFWQRSSGGYEWQPSGPEKFVPADNAEQALQALDSGSTASGPGGPAAVSKPSAKTDTSQTSAASMLETMRTQSNIKSPIKK